MDKKTAERFSLMDHHDLLMADENLRHAMEVRRLVLVRLEDEYAIETGGLINIDAGTITRVVVPAVNGDSTAQA